MNLQEFKYKEMRSVFPELRDCGLIDAVWQYMVDHSRVTESGNIFIQFHVDDKNAFLRKIRTRFNNPSYRKKNYDWMLREIEKKKRSYKAPWYKKLYRWYTHA